MLGYVISEDRDDPNTRMADLAVALMADGLKLAGAVQTNIGQGQDCACDMELTVLGSGAAPVRISQSLGAGSQGCRLDADGLERAVALSARVLTRSTDLLIVNKFGRQEAIGRGFCDLIGTALAACERFYPSFQLAGWGGTSPAAALEIALGETYGRA